MFLQSILRNNQNLKWTIIHAILGLVSSVFPYVLIAWFYLMLFTNFNKAFKYLNHKMYFLPLAWLSYLVSFELLSRLTDLAPFLPYEMGKYVMIVIFSMFLVFGRVKNMIGIIMGIILMPALFFDLSGMVNLNRIIFNLLGPLSLALGVASMYRVEIKQSDFNNILKVIWLVTFTGLIFIRIKTPELASIEFTLESQSETTAGHASNQVSTLMGVGMFLSFYAVLNKLEFSGSKILDIVIMLLFTLQGLLSFSRGGMLVAGGAMALLYIRTLKGSTATKKSTVFVFGAIGLVAAFILFQTANTLTNGNLLLRYQGETRGTLVGSKEKTLDTFTTGRLKVAQEDFQLWYDNFILGVGCGASQFLRETTQGFAAHVEISRLLSEHGLLGLCYILLIVFTYYKSKKGLSVSSKKISFILYLIAILTTFHAAMRTYVPTLFYILSIVCVVPDKKEISK
jgi:hypothetical protein